MPISAYGPEPIHPSFIPQAVPHKGTVMVNKAEVGAALPEFTTSLERGRGPGSTPIQLQVAMSAVRGKNASVAVCFRWRMGVAVRENFGGEGYI